MKLNHIFLCLAATCILAATMSCSDEDNIVLKTVEGKMATANQTVVEQVREAISKELSVGADSHQIESFYERHNIGYSYDRFTHRYHGIIRDVGGPLTQTVTVNIYVNERREFVRAEVFNSFTAP